MDAPLVVSLWCASGPQQMEKCVVKLYYADECPYAQRVRALLRHLGMAFQGVRVDLAARPVEFLDLSPTGKVPLLVDGPLILHESSIICDYLAEKAGWHDAWGRDLVLRTQQRLAMRRFEDFLLPFHYQSMRDPSGLTMEKIRELRLELTRFVETIRRSGSTPVNMPGFLLAPFWARIRWMGAHAPVLSLIMENISLVSWLESTLEVAAIRETLPDRHETVNLMLEKFVYAEA